MASNLEPPELVPASSSSSQPSEPSQKSQSQSRPEQSALDQYISALNTARDAATNALAALTVERNKLLRTILNSQNTEDDTSIESQIWTSGDPTEDDINRGLDAAKKLKANHVKDLQRYNEIKDIAQGLIGLIAEQRGVRVVDVMEEIGVEDLGS